jgi:hypothetical protein
VWRSVECARGWRCRGRGAGGLREDAEDEIDGFRGQVVARLLVCLVRCELDEVDRLAGRLYEQLDATALGEGFRAGEGDGESNWSGWSRAATATAAMSRSSMGAVAASG